MRFPPFSHTRPGQTGPAVGGYSPGEAGREQFPHRGNQQAPRLGEEAIGDPPGRPARFAMHGMGGDAPAALLMHGVGQRMAGRIRAQQPVGLVEVAADPAEGIGAEVPVRPVDGIEQEVVEPVQDVDEFGDVGAGGRHDGHGHPLGLRVILREEPAPVHGGRAPVQLPEEMHDAAEGGHGALEHPDFAEQQLGRLVPPLPRALRHEAQLKDLTGGSQGGIADPVLHAAGQHGGGIRRIVAR